MKHTEAESEAAPQTCTVAPHSEQKRKLRCHPAATGYLKISVGGCMSLTSCSNLLPRAKYRVLSMLSHPARATRQMNATVSKKIPFSTLNPKPKLPAECSSLFLLLLFSLCRATGRRKHPALWEAPSSMHWNMEWACLTS